MVFPKRIFINFCNNPTLVEFSYATGNKLLTQKYVSLLEFLFLLTRKSILLSEITYNLFFVLRLSYSLRISDQYLIGERW